MTTTTQWRVDVDRGPDWLFMRVRPPDDGFDDFVEFAETIWSLASAHFIYRVVLEMDEIQMLPSRLIGQLVLIQKRLRTRGGVLRLSGLSDECQGVMHSCRLDDNLKSFPDRESAVKAVLPERPR